MARREITSQSSAQERAEAARQLQQARQEFQRWWDQAETDPNRPRIEGTDITVITPAEISAQQRLIASRYDYVVFRSSFDTLTGGRILTTGDNSTQLVVPNLNDDGVGPNVTAPSTSLNRLNDAAISLPQDPATVNLGDRFTGPVGAPGNRVTESYPSSDIGNKLRELDEQDPRVEIDQFDGFQQREIPTPQGVIVSGEGIAGSNQDLVVNEFDNDDDSGSVSGTGLDSGYSDESITSAAGDSETVDATIDPGRDDTLPVETETPGAGGSDGIPRPDGSGRVDVSEFARPKKAGSGSSVEENRAGIEIRPNVLHNYANWTYSVALYMLTKDSHASITENGGVTNPGKELSNLLIKSGGTGSRGALGDKRDYHIENFRFTSVIGQNSRTARSSNNFDITFDIVEPYGVAFMAELVQLAINNGVEDHFEIPYLMEIKFRGYDENGNPIPNIPGSGPKYIPIKIVNITFKITSAATIYNVTAVPYSHSPLQNQHDAFIQEAISISGNTFEELMESLFGYLNRSERSKATEQNREPDTYYYVIHDDDLRTSRVGFEHITDGNVISVERQSMGAPGGALSEYIQINGGSTLKSAIQAIAGATDFGARFNTVGQPESEAGNEDRPLRLLKIIPVIQRLGNYNTSTNRYAREIVYRIETQRMYGFVLPDMPGARPTERGWQKEYNWLFTGKNQDILDFQAEYNVQYFNIRNVFTQAKGNTLGTPSAPGNILPDDGLTRTDAGGDTYSPSIVAVTSPRTDSVQNSYRGAAHQLASDHMDNVLNNPGADMMVVNLSIIGDPDFIPQDRSILPQSRSSSGDRRIVNGSLATDVHDLFVMLKFRTPRDYNPEKGLMQIDTDQTFVQGLYRVITLESNFMEGKFEQTLRMIRVQNQISNDSRNMPELTSDETLADTTRPFDPERGGDSAADVEADDRARSTFSPAGSEVSLGTGLPGDDEPFELPEIVFDSETPTNAETSRPSVDEPRSPNTIEDLGSDPEFTFSDFGGP